MAEITRVHGGSGEFEQIGRDLEWRTFTFTANTSNIDLATGDTLPGSHLESLVNVLQTASTVTILGTPTTLTVTAGMEGIGLTDAELDTAIEAADIGTDGSATVVVATVTIDGVTFA